MNEKNNDLERLQKEMRACSKCLKAGFEITPGAIFTGTLGAKILLIGQAPGVTEVTAKRPFNAGSGRRLFQWLGEAGFDEDHFRKTQYMTAVTKCYPGKNGTGRGDRVPSKAEQHLCRSFLEQELAAVDPILVLPVGTLAIRLFFPAKAKLNEIIGTAAYWSVDESKPWLDRNLREAIIIREVPAVIPTKARWVLPLPHPSGASLWPNKPENQSLINRAMAILKAIRPSLGISEPK